MPAGDGSGPLGQGPMTGRSKGDCTENKEPSATSFTRDRGGGRGFQPKTQKEYKQDSSKVNKVEMPNKTDKSKPKPK